MARIRTIKPEFWEDEKIGRLPIPCRLFFIGCWNFADDFGIIKGNAALLKSQIFPYDENLRVSEIKKWIDALVDARMLVPIIHAEESYYLIRTFRSHQVIDKRYDKSYIGKGVVKELINKALIDNDMNTTSSLREHSVITSEEKEEEDKKESTKVDKKEIPKYDDYEFVDADFKDVFMGWLEYKRDRKEKYKSEKSIKACYNRLIKLCDGNPDTARLIVEQSIANNYAGLFELKSQRDNGNDRRDYTSKQEANEYAMRQYIAECERLIKGVDDKGEKPF